MSRTVDLLSLDRDEWQALGDDPERFVSARGLAIGPHAELLRSVGAGTVEFLDRIGVEPRWGSFLATDSASREVVGACSYKGAPDDEGIVEIAYYTFPPNEGAGYATAMAAALVSKSGRAAGRPGGARTHPAGAECVGTDPGKARLCTPRTGGRSRGWTGVALGARAGWPITREEVSDAGIRDRQRHRS